MAELHPLLAVRRHLLERALGAASASRRECEPPRIQHVNGYAESSANAAEQMVYRNLHAFVTQFGLCRAADSKLAHGADHAKTWHVGANEKRSHARYSLTATLDECLRKSRDHSSAVSVTDPDLPAIETPVRAVLGQCRGRLDVLSIGADIGLRQRIGSQEIAPGERRQIALLLLVVAVEHDRFRSKATMDADHDGERRVDRRESFEHTSVRRG